jgi:cytochrome c biogenesis protein
MKSSNLLWNFFSSVKLALFTLGCLAFTSIIGTIIPQQESIQFYANKYGPKTATFFQLLNITDMYTSWWFLSLLGLLALNLIICSIDRFPRVWQQITEDNLSLPLERVKKMRLSASFTSSSPLSELVTGLQATLGQKGWKPELRKNENSTVLFSQKTPWSRAGVYLVHLSILIIFAGAIYGQLQGFRGSIMLPELQTSSVVYPYTSAEIINLNFTIRCDRFDIEFYENTMPKEYKSKLTILENDAIVLQKEIEVNDPLYYKGITFYQASYQPFKDFVFSISSDNEDPVNFTGEFQKEVKWAENNVRFGIINIESVRDQASRLKIWFNDESGEPSLFWMNTGDRIEIKRGEKSYWFSAKQRYATGLQVSKDPGVWLVYLGFGCMIIGLYMAFFMSHKRVWLILEPDQNGTQIYLNGTTNKNATGFAEKFNELADSIEKHL